MKMVILLKMQWYMVQIMDTAGQILVILEILKVIKKNIIIFKKLNKNKIIIIFEMIWIIIKKLL